MDGLDELLGCRVGGLLALHNATIASGLSGVCAASARRVVMLPRLRCSGWQVEIKKLAV